MGRHRTQEEKEQLAEQVRSLRAAGRTRREIVQELHIGDDLAKELSRGAPAPARRGPGAKDEAREAAVALRRAGRTYDQIAVELSISKSSCSLWLRDVPVPDSAESLEPPVAVKVRAGPSGGTESRRERACELRRQGWVLDAIARELGVNVKTVYYWTWSLPVPVQARRGGDRAHMLMMRRRYWTGCWPSARRSAQR